jgi:hypothetical protein
MDPKDIIKLKAHLKIMHDALEKLADACAADQDAKIKAAMTVYKSAQSKYKDAEKAGEPKPIVAHKSVMDAALKKLSEACHEPTQDEKLKQCMTVYRAAESKFKAMVAADH